MLKFQNPKGNDLRLTSQILGDAKAFDTPLCQFETLGTCTASQSPIDCKPTFNVCVEGWTCTYHCKGNNVYNSRAQHCQDLDSCQKSMGVDL